MTMTDLAEPTTPGSTATAKEIADDLQRAIDTGRYQPGDALPSVRELTERYNTSATPVRVAMGELAFSGAIVSEAGQVARVARRPQPIVRDSAVHEFEKVRATIWDDEERGSTGVTEYQTGLGNDYIRPTAVYTEIELDAELATEFSVKVGEPALRREYNTVRTEDGLPIFISTSHLLMVDIAGWTQGDDDYQPLLDQDREPWPGGTMHQLRQVGIEVANVTESFTVRRPTVEEREALEIRRGASVIDLRKILTDTRGLVVEVADATLPDSSMIQHSINLAAWPVSHNDDVDAVIRHGRRGR